MKVDLKRQRDIRKMFSQKYKSPNLMTPIIIEYGETKEHVYELSKNVETDYALRTWMSPLFGVTVLTKDGEKSELSTCFDTYDTAKAFAEKLP